MEIDRSSESRLHALTVAGLVLATCVGVLLGRLLRSEPIAEYLASSAGAQTVADRSTTVDPEVMPGVEVLLRDSVHLLAGKRVGLITNHTGRDRRGRSTIDLLHEASGFQLVAISNLNESELDEFVQRWRAS